MTIVKATMSIVIVAMLIVIVIVMIVSGTELVAFDLVTIEFKTESVVCQSSTMLRRLALIGSMTVSMAPIVFTLFFVVSLMPFNPKTIVQASISNVPAATTLVA